MYFVLNVREEEEPYELHCASKSLYLRVLTFIFFCNLTQPLKTLIQRKHYQCLSLSSEFSSPRAWNVEEIKEN